VNDKEKALVLGANGFMGSHVVDSLVENGFSVRAFGQFDSLETRFRPHEDIELYSGNFLNHADVKEALKGVDYVFHLISTTTPATAEADPLIDIDTNIKGSVDLFQGAVDAGVKRLIYTSSGGTVYGEPKDNEALNENDGLAPISPYGIGKAAIEFYLNYFNVKHGLDSTVFRIANPYGERQPRFRKQGVIPIFIEKILSKEPITVMGDGSMIRDYVYVRDVADMMVRTLKTEPKHKVYNLGSGVGHSLNEIIETIETVSGKKAVISHVETPSTFVHSSVLDTRRYNDEFGQIEMTTFEDGVSKTYEYLKSEKVYAV
jgi:UDP-glucose 4-epimerase